MSPFCGATDNPVLDFWWCLLWVSKPEWAALFVLGGGIHVTFSLRFTFGVIPADVLAASIAAKPSLPYTFQALVGLKTGSYHATTHSVRSGRPDTLPTELSWLSWVVPSLCFTLFCGCKCFGSKSDWTIILYMHSSCSLTRCIDLDCTGFFVWQLLSLVSLCPRHLAGGTAPLAGGCHWFLCVTVPQSNVLMP